MIEVGHNDNEWWKKLDQNLKRLASMGSHQKDVRLRFTKPLLLVVRTIEGEGDDNGDIAGADERLKVRLGVFFCSPKGTSTVNEYRMSLLWNSRTNNLTKALKDFGRHIRATSDFCRWREEEQSTDGWTYLGPDCCEVVVEQVCGSAIVFYVRSLPNVLTSVSSFATFAERTAKSKVLRSYDTRFRTTQRRSEVYEYYSSECKKISIIPDPSEQVLNAADHSFPESCVVAAEVIAEVETRTELASIMSSFVALSWRTRNSNASAPRTRRQ